ncbi:hypothetical protein VOLCADRAFT_69116 [Volvox carteri f. nagariensis]|uniref:3-beta hydroxysteroid dehydrogenase/isomerase domain-containing protein n=1 Tax=Volvox carteri f. nagariensis TaxID=3068 RepID=D8UHS8_VOLCA|nr:uncharacterized protein VOLCADRAFT_69116 [Volvox carteri f. nagariensis]EFJ40738.1 hypothetical protein VOLCADRAFT_69116 [Volvox carteri f. nagariensis]|eukprot:XP_002958204.1 hypothetical protein VOLCADRAFT_69116 [Volvox carteri f. nagariensis]
MRALITGGSGYLGFRLGTELAKQGIEVVLLDIARPAQALPAGVHFFPGSVADAAAVDAAFTSLPGSIDAVFHVASYGMSGRELRDRSKIFSVNVGGTRNVISSCLRYGVPRLVYVSTCNVIFVGKPISGGDETAPYPPPAAYKDAYSSTKAQAEKLSSSSSSSPSGPDPGAAAAAAGCGGRLYTCCIRSTGIWGPGETRHQPRVIRMVRAGLFQATFGEPSSLSDWIYVDNLVQILVLAERGLRIRKEQESAQQQQQEQQQRHFVVYYASDGEPINNFLHFKPFIVGLGYRYPSLNVPFALVYGIAWLIEYAWPLLSHLVADPPLTRMEVDKCCIEHWFDISKARRELGYKPIAYDRAEVVRDMAAAGWAAADARKTTAGRRLLGMNLAMLPAVVLVVALFLAAVYGVGRGTVRQQ